MKKKVNTVGLVKEQAKQLVSQMTIEEKASLMSGANFWNTKAVERLGVKSFMLTDGPHGLRKQAGGSDHLGINESIKSTAFPTAAATASSFDPELLYEMGEAMGAECIQEEVTVILGPGANIKRSPLCGRNFEYFSEDPRLTGDMAAALINGIQSKNVGTSLKHYLANNQEAARLISDSVIDERALREIYLTGFEIAVKEAQPWTLMSSYNKINGIYASSHKELMTDVPRGEWGFEGGIVTDWGGMSDRVEGIEAGVDLEMPAFGDATDKMIVEAIKAGTITESQLDDSAIRMTAIALLGAKNVSTPFDIEKHHELARRIARESAVLLKKGTALPATKSDKVALIGEFAVTPRYQGAGSSKIDPTHLTSVSDSFKENGIDFTYAQGYHSTQDTPDLALIDEAVNVAKEADTIFVLAGLPDSYESEGFDREHINIPDAHNKLIDALVETGKKIVVILNGGSVMALPWRDKVDSILLMNLSGQNSGAATYDLVFGDVSPSGKLAETYPLALEDSSSTSHFGGKEAVEYRESIYVGYRYFDKAEKEVAYPFGHGLSYSTFEYSNLRLNHDKMSNKDTLEIQVTLTNTGTMKAKEIVQVYVNPPESTIYKAVRELRTYTKVELEPGESKDITLTLDSRAFAYYNVNIKDWFVESGDYTIELASSSRDIRLYAQVHIESDQEGEVSDYRQVAPSYYSFGTSYPFDIPVAEFEAVLGRKVPEPRQIRPFTLNSTLGDIRAHWIGRMLYKQIAKNVSKIFEGGEGDESDIIVMINHMINDMPIRQLSMLSEGQLTVELTESLITMMNGHYIKGIKGMLKKK